MDKIIKLRSRNQNNFLRKLTHLGGEESKVYRLVTESIITRSGYTGEGHFFIEPIGGPPLIEGEPLVEAEGVSIKEILKIDEIGYIIIFE